jgi:hypothetical protein
MYQCWVLAAKPRFRWHAAHFSVPLHAILRLSTVLL